MIEDSNSAKNAQTSTEERYSQYIHGIVARNNGVLPNKSDKIVIYTNLLTSVVTIITLIITSIQLSFMNKQTRAMFEANIQNKTAVAAANKQVYEASAANEIARSSLAANDRPWLSLQLILEKIDNQITEVPVNIKIDNVGKSPALSVSYDISTRYKLVNQGDFLPEFHTKSDVGIVFANLPYFGVIKLSTKSTRNRQVEFSNVAIAEITGEVSYKDGVGQPHLTPICRIYNYQEQKFYVCKKEMDLRAN